MASSEFISVDEAGVEEGGGFGRGRMPVPGMRGDRTKEGAARHFFGTRSARRPDDTSLRAGSAKSCPDTRPSFRLDGYPRKRTTADPSASRCEESG
jgi:hypothetical protein